MTTRRAESKLRRILGHAVVAMLVAGCTVGPDYVRPDAPATPVFRGSGGWKPAEPRAELPRGEWWRVFGDADLDALEREVDISNQTVKAAEARVRAAQAATQAARAGLFPGVSANAAALRSSRAGTSGTGPSAPTNSYTAAIDLSWEIDLWGRVRRGVEASDASAQASAADLAAARLAVEALLAQTYLLLRVEDEQIGRASCREREYVLV